MTRRLGAGSATGIDCSQGSAAVAAPPHPAPERSAQHSGSVGTKSRGAEDADRVGRTAAEFGEAAGGEALAQGIASLDIGLPRK